MKNSALTIEEKINLIKKVCEENDITAYEIGENTSISSMGVHNILTGESKNPRNKTLNIILEYIEKRLLGTRLNIDEPYELPIGNIKVEERISDYLKPNKEGVPYYNIDISNNHEDLLNNKIKPNYYIDYELFKDADLWINNISNSMSPIINKGDMVALKKINDLNQILYGEIYAIVLPQISTIKYLRKSKDESLIKLIPNNTIDFDEQEIPKSIIKSIYKVLGSTNKLF